MPAGEPVRVGRSQIIGRKEEGAEEEYFEN